MLNVLIACEESQRVCIEMRKLGHRAFSCDILPCSGGHPEWHIQDDVLRIINGYKGKGYGSPWFTTNDGKNHDTPERWDLIIAHPPCTDLAVSGARYFAKKREDGRQKRSIDFFLEFTIVDCERVAIENPISIMSTIYRKPDQIIQPWQFGHPVRKSTCLWLKGLPKLKETDVVKSLVETDKNGKILQWNDPRTAKERSKTFPGIARAMAEQWTAYIENGEQEEEQISLFEKEDTCDTDRTCY